MEDKCAKFSFDQSTSTVFKWTSWTCCGNAFSLAPPSCLKWYILDTSSRHMNCLPCLWSGHLSHSSQNRTGVGMRVHVYKYGIRTLTKFVISATHGWAWCTGTSWVFRVELYPKCLSCYSNSEFTISKILNMQELWFFNFHLKLHVSEASCSVSPVASLVVLVFGLLIIPGELLPAIIILRARHKILGARHKILRAHHRNFGKNQRCRINRYWSIGDSIWCARSIWKNRNTPGPP